MSNIITLNNISKSFGSKKLFTNLSLHFSDKEKSAIIGRNGTGKSTLLKIVSKLDTPDEGQVIVKKNLVVSYIPQSPKFDKNMTVQQILEDHLKTHNFDETNQMVYAQIALSLCGFTDFEQKTESLSGGWIKRLAFAVAISHTPDFLIMDEPTNHMDWDSINWLESFLQTSAPAYTLVSHDRRFLNNVTNRTIEIGASYKNEHLAYNLPYKDFLEKKEQYFVELEKETSALSNKATRELSWLRAGVKARTTKSRARIQEAHELFDQLKDRKNKLSISKQSLNLKIESSNRKTKKLIELKNISKSYGDNILFTDLDLVIGPKTSLALLGNNGSGKSTLVKIIMGKIKNDFGEIIKAEQLKILYFDQHKTDLDETQTLFEYIGEGSDHTIFQNESIHVASYAAKFLFNSSHFYLKISQLSGGEKARLSLAKLLLNPCDVLILDEPTNDLDIDSITSLENTLNSLNCGMVLISHDRDFLSHCCNDFLALEGEGIHNRYANLEQWLNKDDQPEPVIEKEKEPPQTKKGKSLSYNEQKEFAKIERQISKKEEKLDDLKNQLLLPEIQTATKKLIDLSQEIESLQEDITKSYARWEELESKSND